MHRSPKTHGVFKEWPPNATRMARPAQISVIGYDARSCTKAAYDSAFLVGKAIASRAGIVISGGLGGVMEASCKGAREGGGFAIGIIPSDDASQSNEYCSIVIATGFGHARNFPIVYSADAVIIVGGGAGTLIEAAAAYQKGKPIIAVAGTGGVADGWIGRYLDDRKVVKIVGAETAESAVATAFKIISELRNDNRGQSAPQES